MKVRVLRSAMDDLTVGRKFYDRQTRGYQLKLGQKRSAIALAIAPNRLSENSNWPVFAHLQDDKNSRCYSLFGVDGSDGTHSVNEVPSVQLIRNYEKQEKAPTFP